MKAMPIATESDLRRWLRVRFGSRLFWVEPSAGSTFGVPDCFLALDGQAIFLEAKLAVIMKRDDVVKFNVRPEQRRVITRMMEWDLVVLGVVAVKGTPDVHVFWPDEGFLDGRLKVDDQWDRARVPVPSRVQRAEVTIELDFLTKIIENKGRKDTK